MFTKENIVPSETAYEFVNKFETEYNETQKKANETKYYHYKSAIKWYNKYLAMSEKEQIDELQALNSLQLKVESGLA